MYEDIRRFRLRNLPATDDRTANQQRGATMSMTETKTGGSVLRGGDRRFAGFSLMCLASLGLTLACSQASRPSIPGSYAAPPNAFVTVGPALRIRLADAVVPADAWRRIAESCGGDQARIAATLLDSGYVTCDQSFISASDNSPVVCRWRSRVRIPAPSDRDASPGRLATEDWAYSVRPRINPTGTITVGVAYFRDPPAESGRSQETDRPERWDKEITLPNGATRIFRASQLTPASPMRITIIAAGDIGIRRAPPYSLRHGASSAASVKAG